MQNFAECGIFIFFRFSEVRWKSIGAEFSAVDLVRGGGRKSGT